MTADFQSTPPKPFVLQTRVVWFSEVFYNSDLIWKEE
jgi:hypothetical protein